MAEEKVFVLMPLGNNKKKLLRVNEGSLSHNKALTNSGGWSIPTEEELAKYGEVESAQKKKVAVATNADGKNETETETEKESKTENPKKSGKIKKSQEAK